MLWCDKYTIISTDKRGHSPEENFPKHAFKQIVRFRLWVPKTFTNEWSGASYMEYCVFLVVSMSTLLPPSPHIPPVRHRYPNIAIITQPGQPTQSAALSSTIQDPVPINIISNVPGLLLHDECEPARKTINYHWNHHHIPQMALRDFKILCQYLLH